MNLYFFLPAQLNVTGRRIGVKKLIDNIKIYTRFSTPKMSLEALTDRENTLSPISRIRSLLNEPEVIPKNTRDKLLYELQVLANIYRAEVENTVSLTGLETGTQTPESMCRKMLETFLSEIRLFLKEFRKLHPLFISPRISDLHRTALNWADESISIITERSLNKLFSIVSEYDKPEKLMSEIVELVKNETAYRTSMNYQYLYNKDNPYIGEILAYRENTLKKWAQSAMYMTREESRNQRRAGHIIAGTAAGVAMFFAVFVTIFAGKVFIPNTTPWVLAVIISYIFKDRIKEILRESFKKFLPRLTSDQLSLLYDSSAGEKVGAARSFAKFSKAGSAPSGIRQIRNEIPNPFRSILPEQDLIHYQRVIELNSEKLRKNHTRLTSTTEIIRFHIADWLREMDDPKDIFYRLEEMKKIKIKGNRVYKVHLIMSMKKENQPETEELYHYCIMLNKAGILRIENT